jgi:RNA methyltransferase, RsmE family
MQFIAKVNNNTWTLDEDEARHLKVVRFKTGDTINLFDGKGGLWLGKIETLTDKSASGQIIKTLTPFKPKRKITLCFSVISRPATEELLNLCTQAGVYAIKPVISQRCEKDLIKKWQTKQERWEQIILSAAKQCGSPYLPQILEPQNFVEAVKEAKKPALICYEDEHTLPILTEIQKLNPEELTIFIGPEGGYEPEEIVLAKQHNILSVSLGDFILRAQSAAFAAVWGAMQ